MPFVVMCGFASCGKSARAETLADYIKSKASRKVDIISDHSIGVNRNEIYADSRKEKDVRASLKSAVQRKISKEDVVILDSLNYIKGYRYELYCVTKASQTPHCIIHCAPTPDTAREWNNKRPEKDRYTQEIFDGLVMRFEAPDSRNRWDSPLFIVSPEDELPCQQICDALFQRKAPPPNLSTVAQPLSATNYLHELDKITQTTVSVIMDAQKMAMPGDQIAVPGAKDKVDLVKTLTLTELQRLRRQFISYTKTHTVEDTSRLPNMFVNYINNSIR